MLPEKLQNEKELLARIASGDEEAFGSLFHRYRDKVYFFIVKITGSAQTAGDVLQDVFTRIWMNRATITSIDNFDAYFYRMIRNHVISGMRRMAKEALILNELSVIADQHETGVEHALTENELQLKLQSVLRSLPRQQRLVYTLTREQGLKQQTIAGLLKISVSTVKNHMTQALSTIRHELRHFNHTVWVVIASLVTLLSK